MVITSLEIAPVGQCCNAPNAKTSAEHIRVRGDVTQ
jgi:hypothetical protein